MKLAELQAKALAHPYLTLDDMNAHLQEHRSFVRVPNAILSVFVTIIILEAEPVPVWHVSGALLSLDDLRPIPLARLTILQQHRLIDSIRALLHGVGEPLGVDSLIAEFSSYSVRTPLSAADLTRLRKEG